MSDVPPLRGAPLPPAAPPAPADDLKKLAEQFEAMFLNEMMRPMFDGLSTDGIGGGGVGEQMFRPMLIDQYAQAISQSGGVGLADALVREFARLQTPQPAQDAETSIAPSR
ncbi:MAG TPA: rod-binding protein [Caulobacterales bacterium]|nr:rod-binding protein [Caulobacterales bacterium]